MPAGHWAHIPETSREDPILQLHAYSEVLPVGDCALAGQGEQSVVPSPLYVFSGQSCPLAPGSNNTKKVIYKIGFILCSLLHTPSRISTRVKRFIWSRAGF